MATTNSSAGIAPESLEKENFRINSTSWEEFALPDGTRVKRNPEGDVTELVEGEFAGEQFFTLGAALRETANAGKRMPTKEEWSGIIQAIKPEIDPDGGWQDDISIRESLGLKLVGYCDGSPEGGYIKGPFGSCWSSSDGGICSGRSLGFQIHFGRTRVIPSAQEVMSAGCSVRCLAD